MAHRNTVLDLEKALHLFIQGVPKRQFISVLAGAAVSLAAPANLPAVWNFKRLLPSSFVRYSAGLTKLEDVDANLKYKDIPFERLLQLINDATIDSQPNTVTEILKLTYGRGKPNINHIILTNLLVQRKIHLLLTTNFDDLFCSAHKGIKRVVTNSQWEMLEKQLISGVLKTPTVAHLHGSLTRPDSLVALMRQVGKTLQGPRRRVLEYLLGKGSMIFVGYSGSDEDINPILEQFSPDKKLWALGPTTLRKSKQKKYYRVNLVPNHIASKFDKNALQPLRRVLSPANRQKVCGMIYYGAGFNSEAIQQLSQSLTLRRDKSTLLMLAKVLGDELYFDKASILLDGLPSKNWPHWANWIDARAFMSRHLGRFNQAARDFSELGTELETRLKKTKEWNTEVSDLLVTLGHEIEVSLLVAATKSLSQREQILEHCQLLLKKCHDWHTKASQLGPSFELDYFRAEIALLREKPAQAIKAYEAYRVQGSKWFGIDAITLVALRQAVAWAATGNIKEAINYWSDGFRLGKTSALYVRIQYLIIFPFLYINPIKSYWLMRILAAQMYGIYGEIMFLLLRFRNPLLYRNITDALRISRRSHV